jgi:CheY-like chemotaxis protein
MDLNMPVMDGLKATAILRHRVPASRIIIMTLDDTATVRAEARAQGAHGFVWKLEIEDNLIPEVHQAWK